MTFLGTTVLSVFDLVYEIAEISKGYNMRLHIDAIWGGGLISSQKRRSKPNVIDRNSVIVSLHKLLAAQK